MRSSPRSTTDEPPPDGRTDDPGSNGIGIGVILRERRGSLGVLQIDDIGGPAVSNDDDDVLARAAIRGKGIGARGCHERHRRR